MENERTNDDDQTEMITSFEAFFRRSHSNTFNCIRWIYLHLARARGHDDNVRCQFNVLRNFLHFLLGSARLSDIHFQDKFLVRRNCQFNRESIESRASIRFLTAFGGHHLSLSPSVNLLEIGMATRERFNAIEIGRRSKREKNRIDDDDNRQIDCNVVQCRFGCAIRSYLRNRTHSRVFFLAFIRLFRYLFDFRSVTVWPLFHRQICILQNKLNSRWVSNAIVYFMNSVSYKFTTQSVCSTILCPTLFGFGLHPTHISNARLIYRHWSTQR